MGLRCAAQLGSCVKVRMIPSITLLFLYQATIGLRGIQLFVDAGIPVDADLVRNLIMEVLQEKVSSMVGYPKPQEQKPAETQEVNNHLLTRARKWYLGMLRTICLTNKVKEAFKCSARVSIM